MYKNIILAILIAFIAGCGSKPEPKQLPDWYTNIPKDKLLYFAVGSSDTVNKAKKVAISNMRKSLISELNETFKSSTHTLQPIDKITLEKISQQNSDIAKKLSLKHVKLVRSEIFDDSKLVQISIYKEEIFQILKIISEAKMSRVKQEKSMITASNDLDRFIALFPLMQEYPNLASLTGYKEFLKYQYDADNEFRFLQSMKSEYDELKSSINIFILTDANSRFFAPIIREALSEKELSLERISNVKNSFKLLITSELDESQEYTFKKSKSLIKFRLMSQNKEKISFRQHTFIGKSRKDFQDAKQQSAIDMKNKVDKLGIFDFIGVNKK